MNNENIFLSSKTVDIAEHDNYLELTSCMCYYDDVNLNNVMLPYSGYEDRAKAAAATLVNMPVQAKYKRINNADDLGGHEMVKLPDGSVEFLTESIGTHTEAWIEDSEVTTVKGEVKTLPCLFSKKRIWKRNKNVVNAIKRLFETNGGLNSSWEIATSEYVFKNGQKILTDYEFLGDAFLGSTTTPSYKGTAKALSLSSLTDEELLIAEALSQDITDNAFEIKTNEMEETLLNDVEVNVSSEEVTEEVIAEEVSTEETVETSEVVDDTPEVSEENAEVSSEEVAAEEPEEDEQAVPETENTETEDSECKKKEKAEAEPEVSSLTSNDIRVKVGIACREKIKGWCWVNYIFPEEHFVLCEADERSSELEFLKFTYEINNDEVVVSDPEVVQLTVSVKDVNTTIAEYEKQIAEKDDLIVKAGAEIAELKAANTELAQYKERLDVIEQEKIAAELAQKKEDLIASVIKSGQISREEIEASEELTGYVNELDKKSLMAIVGERLSSSIESNKQEVEISEVETINVASNLNVEDDMDVVSIMRNFIKH